VGKEVGRIEILAIDRVPEERGESMRKYWQLEVKGAEASIFIYGDIVSEPWKWYESDVTSHDLVKEIEGLDVDVIHCYINSYGGEVAEGLAIYNALKRHKAKVKTYCDGFACSAASVVFMAGDERIMSASSLLMIHNAWMWAVGDPDELRKQADDLEIINEASNNAYLEHVNISKDKLQEMLDKETWLTATEALEMGFCTAVVNDPAAKKAANQSARAKIVQMILENRDAERQAKTSELVRPALEILKELVVPLEEFNKLPLAEVVNIMQNLKSEPAPDPEPQDPENKGLFTFLEALASKLSEGDEEK
jgi:ATP-dependent Clp protease protease subunit